MEGKDAIRPKSYVLTIVCEIMDVRMVDSIWAQINIVFRERWKWRSDTCNDVHQTWETKRGKRCVEYVVYSSLVYIDEE